MVKIYIIEVSCHRLLSSKEFSVLFLNIKGCGIHITVVYGKCTSTFLLFFFPIVIHILQVIVARILALELIIFMGSFLDLILK